MSAILNTFTGKNITPKNEAVIYDTAIGESGVFNGCALASLGSNQVSIAAGDGIIKGRKFTIEAETIACALATAGTMPGRIYLKMDLSNATTPLEIKTVVASTLPALVKDEDCNFTNGIYEVAIGTYTASTTAVSNLVPVFNQINLHAILKTKAEVTANTEPGRLADALVVKEIITSLNAPTVGTFIYDYQNGKPGCNTSPTRGADTFIPFNKPQIIPLVQLAAYGNTGSSATPKITFNAIDRTKLKIASITCNWASSIVPKVYVIADGTTIRTYNSNQSNVEIDISAYTSVSIQSWGTVGGYVFEVSSLTNVSVE